MPLIRTLNAEGLEKFSEYLTELRANPSRDTLQNLG
jgi:hypothetical protein